MKNLPITVLTKFPDSGKTILLLMDLEMQMGVDTYRAFQNPFPCWDKKLYLHITGAGL